MFQIRPVTHERVLELRRNTGMGLSEATATLRKEALIEGALEARTLADVKVVLLALAYAANPSGEGR